MSCVVPGPQLRLEPLHARIGSGGCVILHGTLSLSCGSWGLGDGTMGSEELGEGDGGCGGRELRWMSIVLLEKESMSQTSETHTTIFFSHDTRSKKHDTRIKASQPYNNPSTQPKLQPHSHTPHTPQPITASCHAMPCTTSTKGLLMASACTFLQSSLVRTPLPEHHVYVGGAAFMREWSPRRAPILKGFRVSPAGGGTGGGERWAAKRERPGGFSSKMPCYFRNGSGTNRGRVVETVARRGMS